MERLTFRNDKGEAHMNCNQMCADFYKCNPDVCQGSKAVQKLAEYEDAEEQGLLLRLPCKIGDTVWFVGEKYVNDYEVRNIVLNETGIAYIKMAKKIDGEDYWLSCYYEDFGVRAFLSESEAEQALADKGV